MHQARLDELKRAAYKAIENDFEWSGPDAHELPSPKEVLELVEAAREKFPTWLDYVVYVPGVTPKAPEISLCGFCGNCGIVKVEWKWHGGKWPEPVVEVWQGEGPCICPNGQELVKRGRVQEKFVARKVRTL